MAAVTVETHITHTQGRTLIVGLGKSGLSVARFLSARGETVALTDSRAEPPMLRQIEDELPDTALFIGGFSAEAFAAADRLVVSPGISLREPLIAEASARGIEVMGDIELFARYADAPVAAITGSNGKTTVTTLLGEMAREAGREVRVGGNIGTPALDLITDTAPDLYVLELSSFQLETTRSLRPAVAVVLNLSADHMDRYGNLDEYAQAKAAIFAQAGVCVYNGDDAAVAAMLPAGASGVSFGEAAGNTYHLAEDDTGALLMHGDTVLLAAGELRLAGKHNRMNVLAAFAMGEALGLPVAAMQAAVRRFAGLPHRTQWVAECNGVSWYNDSKGTNTGATLAAIEGLAGDHAGLVLIAGGEGKGADFSVLRRAVAEHVRALVLIGRDAPLIEAALQGTAPMTHAADMAEAVRQAAVLARPGDAVLLSPACASFDMFNNYEHRGEVFMLAVREVCA